MDRARAVELLKECLKEIPHLKELHHHNQERQLWENKVEDIIKAGLDADDVGRFLAGRQYLLVSPLTLDNELQKHYLENVNKSETNLKSIIQKYEILGLETQPAALVELKTARAFIAHEGQTVALSKLTKFLDALGIKCLMAEGEPSDGRSVERQVKWTYQQADFVVILATKGRAVDKRSGEAYMGMNVADELGRARGVFNNRIILLLQSGVEPHANISEIVYERFTPQSMDKALTKIARELTGWGLIRASREEMKKNVQTI